MSIANYNASAINHAEILICIQTVGTLPESDLVIALSKIQKHSQLMVADAGRTVNFRFELDSSPDNSKWGFFQPHRRVMGLLVLASCSSAMEVALLHESFQKQKEAFSDCIFDARCFVFGFENVFTQQNKAEVFQFTDVSSWKSSDDDITSFLTSVFYVLESKRLQMIADKSDRPPLLTTPFEKSQQNASDSDSKTFRKKCLGRWKKYLGDICLLAGLKIESLQNYNLALDLLTSVNDQVWLGAALEGLCVVSSMTSFDPQNSVTNSTVIKTSNKQVLDPRNLRSSTLSSIAAAAEAKKLSIQSASEFVDQYKAAVIYYSRSENMGVVELEACIKATRVMAVLNKRIQAAEFLQNAVYIAMKVSDEERIIKYSVLADLYAEISFHRKSAFYRRVAAMQCVAPHLQQADWKKCYSLLQGTFDGYDLKLHSDSGLPLTRKRINGWPQVQIRVLQELLFSAGKNGKHKAANRYAIYLMLRLHPYFSVIEEKEACSSLQSTQRQDANKSSEEFPSIDFYNLPQVRSFEPQPLSEQIELSSLNSTPSKSSVFLFTPSTYHSAYQKHIKFKWCVNSTSSARIELFNPLRTQHLHVTDIEPIYEGDAQLHCRNLDVSIPPGQSMTVNMMLRPTCEGTVLITGYQATVFGVTSRCLFSNMPWISTDSLEIDVVVELPILQRENSCLSHDVNYKMMITLYRGETRLLEVPFTNASKVAVEYIHATSLTPVVVVDNKAEKSSLRQSAHWLSVACSDVQDQLPIQPQSSLILPIIMKTDGKLEDLNTETPARSCQIQIKYSSLGGVKENYSRNTAVYLMASLQTCVYVLSVTIRQSIRQGFCIIAVRVSDVSEDDVIVCSSKLKDVDMYEWGGKKAEYEDDKLVLARMKPDDTALIEARIPMLEIEGSIEKDQINRQLKQTLSDCLSLCWIIQDDTSSRTGRIDLSSCELDPISVANCIVQPLLWKMFAKNRDVNDEAITCDVGDNFPVRVLIENTSDESTQVDVDLEIFQDQENGFREWNMEDCAICVGCQSQSFTIPPRKEVDFECSLIFLLCGSYYIRMRRILDTDESTPEHETRYYPSNYEAINYKRFSPSFVVHVSDV